MQRQFVVTGNANDSTARAKAFVADFQALVEKHGLSFSEMAKALTSVGAEVEAESLPATNSCDYMRIAPELLDDKPQTNPDFSHVANKYAPPADDGYWDSYDPYAAAEEGQQ